jgi:hypothetical protein
MERAAYVTRVLHLYRRLPATLGRILRDDRRTALDLHRRDIPIAVVENAFILVTARRAARPKDEPLDPIRVLRYILPVIEELLSAPPEPGYIRYLESRVRENRLYNLD